MRSQPPQKVNHLWFVTFGTHQHVFSLEQVNGQTASVLYLLVTSFTFDDFGLRENYLVVLKNIWELYVDPHVVTVIEWAPWTNFGFGD